MLWEVPNGIHYYRYAICKKKRRPLKTTKYLLGVDNKAVERMVHVGYQGMCVPGINQARAKTDNELLVTASKLTRLKNLQRANNSAE